jgi:integrase
MSRKLSFTPAAIDMLRSGNIHDPQTPGLIVEALTSGKRVWKFQRRLPGTKTIIKARKGLYPAISIGAAREWGRSLNEKIELGINPVEEEKAEQNRATMTIENCHKLYMAGHRRGEFKAARRKKRNKPRTLSDKQKIYNLDIGPHIGERSIYEITRQELWNLVNAKGATAPSRANRLAAELKVFFGWCASQRGISAGIELEADPATKLEGKWFPEDERTRWLDHDELPLFLLALAQEERLYRRALLLFLLTGCRSNEILEAPTSEYRAGIWTIPGERTKNSEPHAITFGPWGRSLFHTNDEWVIPSPKKPGPMKAGWPKVLKRIRLRMEELGGRPVEHFTPHDLRRTMRSHLDDLMIDETTCERMINHQPTGLIKRYNRNKRAAALAVGFLAWENALIEMAKQRGVAGALDVPITTEVELQSTAQLPLF